MTALGEVLLRRTAQLVDISSVSHDEQAIADVVEAELRELGTVEVTRIANNVIGRTRGGRAQRLLLGGHLDTVPPLGNSAAHIEDGLLYGCGSTDMKGGLAVLLQIARELGEGGPDVSLVFYAKEEVARRDSGLLEIESSSPELLDCDVALLLEPTGGVVEAGCQGVLRVRVTVAGVAAHSARPWTGRNAIHRLAPVLERINAFVERRPVIDGCTYHESLQVVRIDGGTGANVVPDAAHLVLSYRFAPDRDSDQAQDWLEGYLMSVLDLGSGDAIVVEERAPSAPPGLSHQVLAALVTLSGCEPRAKLAWTDVAFFARRGIPAANFGPGDPLLAHSAGESVSADALAGVHRVLARLVSGAW